MERLYVVTHPEASHHLEKRVGGWYDSHLTDRGLQDAASIARHLRDTVPSGVVPQLVSSDLLRTRQTAAAIGEAFGVEPVLDAGLREKSYGVAEGRPQGWLDERYIFAPAVGERLDHDEGIEGAETTRIWAERVYEAVARLQEAPAEHRVIVTHGGSIRWVIAAWMRIPLQACAYASFRVPSGSVSVLVEEAPYHNRSLITLGDRSFIT